MSTWAYCDNCNKSLKHPNFVDASVGHQKCQHCDTPRTLDDFERRYVLEQAAEALCALSKMAGQAAEAHGLDRAQWDRFTTMFAPAD